MKNHLRANAWLLVLIVALVCVLYPAAIWVYANWLFPAEAAGSLLTQKQPDGAAVVKGSSLIGQPFSKDWYFQPRPSAASYNAAASGASNWAANNPKLRDRVARQLGTVVKYNPDGPKRDDSVQTDIETWFADSKPLFKDFGNKSDEKPPVAIAWARGNSGLAGQWVKADANKAAVIQWLRDHPKLLSDWRTAKPDASEPNLDDDTTIPFDDIAVAFFESFAEAHPDRNAWPNPVEFDTQKKDDKGEAIKGKRFEPVAKGADLQATMFETWLADPANAGRVAELKPVPADMVMASGSGLDPHITLRNAEYQLDGVIKARAKEAKRDPAEVRAQTLAIVKKHTFTPLSGLVGEPLVNVLEVNRDLDKQLPIVPEPAKAP
jgi:potassium-transporting ATPase KdpC subunit